VQKAIRVINDLIETRPADAREELEGLKTFPTTSPLTLSKNWGLSVNSERAAALALLRIGIEVT
jgi:hypothetical protein